MILGKMAMDLPSIKDRIAIHDIPCEIQVLNKHLNDPKVIEEFMSCVKDETITPYFLHSPCTSVPGYQSNSDECYVTPFSVTFDEDRNILYKLSALAEEIRKYVHRPVSIILHNDNLSIEKQEASIDTSMQIFANLFSQYRHVLINLENITGWDAEQAGYNDEAAQYIRVFEQAYPQYKGKLGATFDTCHAIATIRRLERMPAMSYLSLEPAFRERFEALLPYVRHIHLNNCFGYGEDQDHSAPFDLTDSEHLNTLLMILRTFKVNKWNGDIVLEIKEDSYPSSINHKITYDTVMSVLQNKEEYRYLLK